MNTSNAHGDQIQVISTPDAVDGQPETHWGHLYTHSSFSHTGLPSPRAMPPAVGFLSPKVLTSSPSPSPQSVPDVLPPFILPSSAQSSSFCLEFSAPSSVPRPAVRVCFSSWRNSSSTPGLICSHLGIKHSPPSVVFHRCGEKGSHVLEREPMPSTSGDPGK